MTTAERLKNQLSYKHNTENQKKQKTKQNPEKDKKSKVC